MNPCGNKWCGKSHNNKLTTKVFQIVWLQLTILKNCLMIQTTNF